MVLTSFVAATDGFGIDLFAQLVPDMRAGLVIGLAGLALGSLSDRIGLRAAMLLAYGCIFASALILADDRQP